MSNYYNMEGPTLRTCDVVRLFNFMFDGGDGLLLHVIYYLHDIVPIEVPSTVEIRKMAKKLIDNANPTYYISMCHYV